ncbi:ComEC/Rec2 family competence protein [Oceanobacillus sp. J11TS1]|uniref:ComEC/Rec2 family competence protein n=1 Tax=Oceanobacillus sp. J11TS1 TaxID=2807191 RepID=UPI001B0112BD|nr:MBL fold metallo-hydrolase [Oceanobacillus sp. J11TS1]GIO24898.1 competence protein ComE [Oceanobacillus sp. J11TS1]
MWNRGFIFLLMLAVIHFYNPAPIHAKQEMPSMKVHFINVGQGDSILIETPLERTILIDGGPPRAGDAVVKYLKERRINEIDLLVATHPDIDHIGGLVKVLKKMEVGRVIDTGKLHPTKTFATYMNRIRDLEIPITIAEKDTPIEIDPMVSFEIWNAAQPLTSPNASSLVLKLTYGETDMLFMGDVGKKEEKAIQKKYDVHADLIKIGHHGSNTSSAMSFLKAVDPEIAILTYSKDNNYGHPVPRVIDHLNKINALIYSTAALDSITVETDGDSLIVNPKMNPIQKFVEEGAG